MGIIIKHAMEETGILLERAYVNIQNIKINKNRITGYYNIYTNYELSTIKSPISTNYFEFVCTELLSNSPINIYDIVYTHIKSKLKDVFITNKQ